MTIRPPFLVLSAFVGFPAFTTSFPDDGRGTAQFGTSEKMEGRGSQWPSWNRPLQGRGGARGYGGDNRGIPSPSPLPGVAGIEKEKGQTSAGNGIG